MQKIPFAVTILCVLAIAGGASAAHEGSATKSYRIPGHGRLELTVPAGWLDSFAQESPRSLPVLTFTRKGQHDPLVLVTVIWDAANRPDFNAPPAIRQMVERAGVTALRSAVERTIIIADLVGSGATGHYFTLTDRNLDGKQPGPEEYRYLTQGAAATGPLILSFSILSNARNSLEVRTALSLITGAHHSTSEPEVATDAAVLSLPDQPWELRLDLPGFFVSANAVHPDGLSRQLAAQNEASGVVVTVFLEQVGGTPDAPACRDRFWQQYWSSPEVKPIQRTDVSMSTVAGYPAAEYVVHRLPDAMIPDALKDLRGRDLNQKHVDAYLARGGACVDVHLSKMEFRPGDERLFEAALKGVKIQTEAAGK